MSNRITIGIDNGSTGSIAILGPDTPFFEPMPVKEWLMGKAGKLVQRINHRELGAMLSARLPCDMSCVRAYVERPFTGSAMMINTSVLSARSYEAVLIVLEQLGIGLSTVDSKEWQAAVLGGIKGSIALKKASKLRGCSMYPALAGTITDHGDADGLLMAHHFHRNPLA